MDNILMMLLMTTVTQTMGPIIQNISNWIIDIGGRLCNYLSRRIINKKIYSVQTEYDIVTSGGYPTTTNHCNEDVIMAVLSYINSRGICDGDATCDVVDVPAKYADRIKQIMSRKFTMRPIDNVKCDDFDITYVNTQNKGTTEMGGLIANHLLTIKSHRGVAAIREFMQKCHADFMHQMYTVGQEHVYLYKQTENKDNIMFRQFEVNNKLTFADIFFPEKNKVIELIDALKSGQLSKLSLLLYGSPGCGKTSIIKAAANYLGYSIIEVKLSTIRNDADLFCLFFDAMIPYVTQCGSSKLYVPINRRIYIFEDVDAECDAVKDRTAETAPDKVSLEKLAEFVTEKKAGVTLSGLLNVFDGVLDLDGPMIILTTNHPEQLDSALVRPGRITMKLELRPITADGAEMMIKRKWPDWSGPIPADGVITPATLAGLCDIAADEDELATLLSSTVAGAK